MTGKSKKSLVRKGSAPSNYHAIPAHDSNATEVVSLTNLQLLGLTICMVGVQFTWTVELSYGTPYLLSLELPQSLTALVWLAGPLSGLIVQPLIGAFSDKSTISWGRRRPFIVGGGLITLVSMAGVAYAREIGDFFVDLSKGDGGFESQRKNAAIIVAVLSFYFLDFSLNAVQAACRALILDVPPLWQQEIANAWVARLNSLSMILGYFAGFLDLPAIFPFLGNHQVKVFCVISIIILSVTLTITCLFARERPFIPTSDNDTSFSFFGTFNYIMRAFRYLPSPVQRLCNVQFFTWMGWFPFLFYSTTWIASVYALEHDPTDPTFWEQATRAGSLALFYYAVISFIAGLVLPAMTPKSANSTSPFTMKNIFTFSLLWFSLGMFSTFWVADIAAATLVIAATGFPWAVQMWVPFALIGEYVMAAEERKQIAANNRRIHHNDNSASSANNEESQIDPADEFEAGMILGVHNMYIVFPQFAVAIISSIIFAIVNSAKDPNILIDDPSNGDDLKKNGVAWILRFGGFMTLLAAVASRRIEEMKIDRPE